MPVYVYKWNLKYRSGKDYISILKINISFFGKDLLPFQNHIGKKNLNFLRIKHNTSCMCHNILYMQSFTAKLSAFMT